VKLELAEIVKRLKAHGPEHEIQLLELCKLPLQYLDCGQYRRVYKIVDTAYVIKVPIEYGVEHSAAEIKALKRLQKTEIASVLPTFHYSNRNTGIILTDFCKTGLLPQFKLNKRVIYEWAKENGYADSDTEPEKWDNYGTLNGKLKLLDLGCFTKGGC